MWGKRRWKPSPRVATRPPDLQIETHVTLLEAIPFGVYRGAGVIVSGLDSRPCPRRLERSRLSNGAGSFGSTAACRPTPAGPGHRAAGGHDAPCLECDWTDADYAALEQRYLCGGKKRGTPDCGVGGVGGRLAASGMMRRSDPSSPTGCGGPPRDPARLDEGARSRPGCHVMQPAGPTISWIHCRISRNR